MILNILKIQKRKGEKNRKKSAVDDTSKAMGCNSDVS